MGRRWGGGGIWQGGRRAVGSAPATAGAAALQGGGPSLGRPRSPSPGAGARLGAESPGAAAGARGSGADPGCREISCPRSAEAGQSVPGSRRLSSARELSNTSTKRKGNQPALTCKQGLPSGGASSHRPPSTLTCTPIRLHPTHLPAPGPSRRGTRAGGGCSSRPRRLRPRVRGSQPPGECPAPGPRRPACPVGVVDPEVSSPRLGSAPELPGFTRTPARSPARSA